MNSFLSGCWSVLLLAAFFAAGMFAISLAFGQPYTPAEDALYFWSVIGRPTKFVVIVLAGTYVAVCLKNRFTGGVTRIRTPGQKPRIASRLLIASWLLGSIIALWVGGVFIYRVFQTIQWP